MKNELTIFNRLARLLSVKSLVTVTLTFVFGYLSLISVIDSDKFMTIFTTIIGFYFGTQATKE